jgi:hypothetical protein
MGRNQTLIRNNAMLPKLFVALQKGVKFSKARNKSVLLIGTHSKPLSIPFQNDSLSHRYAKKKATKTAESVWCLTSWSGCTRLSESVFKISSLEIFLTLALAFGFSKTMLSRELDGMEAVLATDGAVKENAPA